MPKKSTKVIVTGGAGFVGSHLTDALVKEGFEVHVLDNLLTGKKENLNPRAIFHKTDIRDLKTIQPFFKGAVFVFHLAALPRVPLSIEDPKTTHDINLDGTLNVLLAARNAKVKRVIYSASSSAYGDQKQLPLKEYFKAQPLSPYGLQKYVGEEYCRIFSRIYGLETVSLRYFNVYGPRMSEKGSYIPVFMVFLNQLKKNKPMTITGDGRQTRNFTHVKDVVSANLLAAQSKSVGLGEVVNICGGRAYSINEVVRMIGGPAVRLKPRSGDIKYSRGSNALAKKLLGWSPKIKLEDGVRELKRIYFN